MSEPAGRLVLVRHGETDWSRTGRHTSTTDVALTTHGREQAARLRRRLAGWRFALVVTSPLERARCTAELAGLAVDLVDPRLAEWDYGRYEGRTTAQIRQEVPGWTVWRGPVPGGETARQVGRRADVVLEEVGPRLADGDVALVGHGHMLRVLTARWLGLAPRAGALFVLDAGGLSLLGFEHGTPVVRRLNEPA